MPGAGSFLRFSLLRPAGEALGSAGGPPTRSLSTTNSSSGSGAPGPSGLVRQNSTSLTGKPGALPTNLDDMKVGGCAPMASRCRQPGLSGRQVLDFRQERWPAGDYGHGRQSRALASGFLQWRNLEPA